MTNEILLTDEAKVWFDGIRAVDGVTITLEQGLLHGIVGPNGSGKTTLLNAISGLTPLTAGAIQFLGHDLTSMAAHEVSRVGVARTFQGVRLVPTLSVRDNVLLAADRLLRPGFEGSDAQLATRSWRQARAQRRLVLEAADNVLERLHLGAIAERYPHALPYGAQRRVEIARALVAAPKLLLLDEPIAGMSHEERVEIAQLLKQLRAEGLTQLIIEHDLRTLLEICDHLFVLDFGRCVAQGPPREAVMHPEVQEAYLGRTNAGA